MKLIITEKPSVAVSIANSLGKYIKRDGFLEGKDYIISWCVGHLISLSNPGAYDEKFAKWNYIDLPILPKDWIFNVNLSTKQQYNILEKLIKNDKIEEIVSATDAGREGELIFRLVYNQVGVDKPFKRLWISSMEDTAIREGFANLKDGHDFDNLYESALARSKADWLVGLNATRLFTTLYYQKLSVGRVQTPTLAMMAKRDTRIKNFDKEKYYHVFLDLGEFKVKSDKIIDADIAKELKKITKGQKATIKEVKSEIKKNNPPLPYDLTTLQRESNRAFGYTAKQTLDYTQSLYEKKWVTYPRTDSRYLTEDMKGTVSDLIVKSKEVIDNPNIDRIINNKKVIDHHAIIPTGFSMNQDVGKLAKNEQNVYKLITMRLLCSVHAPYVFERTNVTAIACEKEFRATGKVELEQGFKDIEKQFKTEGKKKDKDDVKLPKLTEGMVFDIVKSEMKEGLTKPPKHYTEDTLLSAMEKAGVEALDKTLDTEKKGLGTPATRASIIEKLITVGYVERVKKNLIVTEKGISLIEIMPDNLKSPELTSEWENKLTEIAAGTRKSDDFLVEIEKEVTSLVKENKDIKAGSGFKVDKESLGHCPRCDSRVYESAKNFYCSNRECKFAMFKEDRFFLSKRKTLTAEMVKGLLKDRKTGVKGFYSEKKSKTYDASVVMEDTGVYVNYKLVFDMRY